MVEKKFGIGVQSGLLMVSICENRSNHFEANVPTRLIRGELSDPHRERRQRKGNDMNQPPPRRVLKAHQLRMLKRSLRTAVAIIKNDAWAWHNNHGGDKLQIRERWCREMLEESGIREFERRYSPK